MGYWMDWNNPKSFCEKLQWLKIYDKHPEYTKMVDKVAAKEYVAGIIGEQYIIPTLAVYNSAEEINFDALPNQFVLKCTHDSGSLVICRDKSIFDCEATRKKMRKGLKRTYIIQNREYPYKNVHRRIIAETYLKTGNSKDLIDYKFFCFNGKAEFCQMITNRNTHETIDFYDRAWIHQPFTGLISTKQKTPPQKIVDMPEHYKKMVDIADKLSSSITAPFVRIDLYNIHGNIYFSEITFFPKSGLGFFRPNEWNNKLGELIELPTMHKS